MILRHTFLPHNNTRLTHLCGPADAHLRTIEVALGVGIAHRHEQFKVDGPKAKATQAMELLQALYEIAERPIPEDHLQLMLAGDSDLLDAPEDAIVLSTRRADLRGRTLNNAFVILDEAQNTTPEQMKMFLTRIGFGSRAVVTGDVSQIDLPKGAMSGLIDAERVLKRVKGIAITRFTSADVVRHPLVARIVDAYDAPRRALAARS